MAKCKILLSGATGFIGQRLAAHLLAAGYHISALYRNERSNLAPGISWVRVRDLATDAPDPDIGRGIDIFIHLAATVRPSSGDPSGQIANSSYRPERITLRCGRRHTSCPGAQFNRG